MKTCAPSRFDPVSIPPMFPHGVPGRLPRLPERGRRPQAGFAALTMAAVLLMCCIVWLAAGFLRARGDERTAAIDRQASSLRQAERAVAFFAGARNRLPCPAESVDGTEACVADAGGWLPSASLGLTGGMADSDDVPVRYLPYRSGDAGVAMADASAVADDRTALCARLRDIAPDISNPWLLAEHDAALDRPGDPFPAVYGLIAMRPGRDDVSKKAVGPTTLYESLECASASASLDSLALGLGLPKDARNMRNGNEGKAAHLGNVMRMLILHRSLELDLAVFDLAAGAYALNENQMKLQAAITATLAGFPPPPNAIPSYIAGIASATTALRLNAIDIPRAAVSLALDAATLRRYRDAAGAALDAPLWQGEERLMERVRRPGRG